MRPKSKRIRGATSIEGRRVFEWNTIISEMKGGSSRPSKIQDHFDFIRIYHGCRPEKVDSYNTDGVLVLDRKEVQKSFRKVFSDVPTEFLDQAIAQLNREENLGQGSSDVRGGRLYACPDYRLFLEDCGHYLIYGSEYLSCLAMRIQDGSGVDYRQRLLTIGRPTLIEINAPVEKLSEWNDFEWITSLERDLKDYQEYIRVGKHVPPLNFSFILNKSIPPQWIGGYQFPDRIVDSSRQAEYCLVDGCWHHVGRTS